MNFFLWALFVNLPFLATNLVIQVREKSSLFATTVPCRLNDTGKWKQKGKSPGTEVAFARCGAFVLTRNIAVHNFFQICSVNST